MKHLLIAGGVLVILLQLGGLMWSSYEDTAKGAFKKLIEPPPRTISNPYENGYFYLFGLTTGAAFDPVKTGYEIWVEESGGAHPGSIVADKSSRSRLSLEISLESTAESWNATDPLALFRKKGIARPSPASPHHTILLTRYDQWLGLPFEDWGFGRRIAALNREIMATHRLYIAEGFAHGTTAGIERFRKELFFWRMVLREAKTISTKVLAQVVITDDVQLLSNMLANPSADQKLLTMGMQLTLPLSESDYSLRWPVGHQLSLAVADARTGRLRSDQPGGPSNAEENWLISAANLPPRAFDTIEHPADHSRLGGTLTSAKTWESYEAFYTALIEASENRATRLPRMQAFTDTNHRGILEGLFDAAPLEPGWDLFHRLLIETDTKLRLASLQIQLRQFHSHMPVPTRLAQVGSEYFDPFTGLPMLWSPTQRKVYSVGPDRLDDGGDSTFDISVPAIVSQSPVSTQASATGLRAGPSRK